MNIAVPPNNAIIKTCDQNPGYYAGARSEMLRYLPQDALRILDVGCGEGNLGALIRQSGERQVWGIDIDAASIEVAETKLDKAICGSVTDNYQNLPDGHFDVVFFNDVLEHLVDPYSLLTEIRSKLSHKGVIIASIPNVRYFRVLLKLCFQQDWQYEESGILDKTHLRFFTRKSILRMFDEAGYEVEKVDGLGRGRSKKPFLMNLFTFGKLGMDTAYYQFAVVARPK